MILILGVLPQNYSDDLTLAASYCLVREDSKMDVERLKREMEQEAQRERQAERESRMDAKYSCLTPDGRIMEVTLAEIQRDVDRLAANIGAPERLLPTYGRTEDFARPHIEVDQHGLHYVIVDRGQESRSTTSHLDELYFWVFRNVTFDLAAKYELAHRVERQDFRRILFRRKTDLLAALSPEWADRESQRQKDVLKDFPYDDLADSRAEYCKELRGQGHADMEAWQLACKRYPLPTAK